MSDEPFLKTEVGWYGLFTRRQADGAIANGERIVKTLVDPGETSGRPVGWLGTVLGSLDYPQGAIDEAAAAAVRSHGLDPADVKYAYFVEWDGAPRQAVGVMDFKIARADGR